MIRLLPASLFAKLVLAFVAATALAFLLNVWLTVRTGRGALERLVEESLDARAEAVLLHVNEYLSLLADEVGFWATLEVLDDILIEDHALRIENLLLNLKREHAPDYLLLSVVDREEEVVASTDPSRIGSILAVGELTQGWDLNHSVTIVPGAEPDDMPQLFIARPIQSRLATEPIGILVAAANWNRVEEIVAGSPIGGREQSVAGFALLFDTDGTLVAGRRDIAAQMAPPMKDFRLLRNKALATLTLDGAEYLAIRRAAGREYPDLAEELFVATFWRADEAYAVVRQFALTAVGSFVLALALAAGASYLLARGITRRLRRLAEGTHRLAEGDLAHRVEVGAYDEIGQLAHSFNEMGEELSEAMQAVETVSARWRALVTHAPDVIMTVSRDGRIVFANRSLTSGDGSVGEALEGKSLHDLLPEKHFESLRAALDRTFERSEQGNAEVELPGPGGVSRWFSVRTGPIRQEGEVWAANLIWTDVSDRKRLEHRILEAVEMERERIGQDLHDDVGQILTGASLLAGALREKLGEDSGAVADLERIRGLVNQAIRHSRDLARGLHSASIGISGLRAALEDLAASVTAVSGVACRVQGGDLGTGEDRQRPKHLFRIVQEAVSNSLRHANPHSIVISLLTGQEGEGIAIVDDGIGFDPASGGGEGLGLLLMRHRASMIGASLEVTSGPGRGTTIRCHF